MVTLREAALVEGHEGNPTWSGSRVKGRRGIEGNKYG